MKTTFLFLSFLFFKISVFGQKNITHKVEGNKVIYSTGYEAEAPDQPTIGRSYYFSKTEGDDTIHLTFIRKSAVIAAYEISIVHKKNKPLEWKGNVDLSQILFLENVESRNLEGKDDVVDCLLWLEPSPAKERQALSIYIGDAEDQEIDFPPNSLFVDLNIPMNASETIQTNGFMTLKK